MTEEKYEVKVYKVIARCECGGQMKPTGRILDMYPQLYVHECEMCGAIEHYYIKYPQITYEPIFGREHE